MKNLPPFSRRRFLQAAAVTSAVLSLPLARAQNKNGANKERYDKKLFIPADKPLRLAAVGCGGMGAGDITSLMKENERGENVQLVALCDVDDTRAQKTFDQYPDLPRFKDFRELLQKMGDRFDAVTVSTPDHMHFPIAMTMMQAKKHVYVQKPLAHTIGEVRLMKKQAWDSGVVAAMGNQGHANEGTRLQYEWIRSGLIGNVREVHAWTNRPIWPQGVEDWYEAQDIPEALDWDLWLGVSQKRDYNAAYVPFKWRGYFEWGAGAIGDMAVHTLDAIFKALDLKGDCRVSAETDGMTEISWPKGAKVTFEFPERDGRAPLKLVWFEGSMKPPRPDGLGKDEEGKDAVLSPTGGSVYYGDKGVLYNSHSHNNAAPRLLPEAAMAAAKADGLLPPKTLPRAPRGNAYHQWIKACRGELESTSDIGDSAAEITELALLGNLAMRAGKPIEWDSKNARVKGMPELDALINKSYRKF